MHRRDFNLALFGALSVPGLTRQSTRQGPVRVNGDRLGANLRALGAIGKTEAGAQRVAYSEADRAARALTLDLMRAAQLEASVDAAGNLIGRRAGSAPALPPILFGSHIDSVPNGGDFDGPVGSLSAIEAAHTLAERGIRTRHPLEVVVFQNEEGGLIGSLAMVGALTPAHLDRVSQSGMTIREGIATIGGDPERLESVARRPGSIAGYLELHIEQGAILDAESVQIGVVEGIVGIGWWDVTIEGVPNHAGTTPMDKRRDALLSAARFIEEVNRIVRSVPGRQVGTVGRIEALPGAPNVIPGTVRVSLELRDLDAGKIRSLYERIAEAGHAIGRADGTHFEFRQTSENVPALTTGHVRDVVRTAAQDLGLSAKDMPSGAGHDAQDMAKIGPMGMVFIPSVGGVSHSPREFSRPEDVVNGANVLMHAVLGLDRAAG
ncbi:MAG: M20 family metallo-hydrolase [Gemmatimonadota bacterium]|nr:M20 family metallo-hydrolase [Gemmatimonadota bacterium]MDH4351523.1 M20 family metallo-hydrolase [Gemmatimonadota bacterium]MDH5197788.1 M20 family metallo-hydrolase [Gemmatimonadota bacterium]